MLGFGSLGQFSLGEAADFTYRPSGVAGVGVARALTPVVTVTFSGVSGTGQAGTSAPTSSSLVVTPIGATGVGVARAPIPSVAVPIPVPSATGGGVAGEIRTTISGGGGPRKKKPTGFEPVIKLYRKPEKPEPPKVWTPPAEHVRSPSIVPRLPAPDIVDPEIVPTGLLGIVDQMQIAEDISDINRFLAQLEQDEQDARDIADVLALLD